MNLSTLLQRSEGDSLDFKLLNYRFKNAVDEEKSELLKDVLALANAWKATDGYLIIGAEETNGRVTNLPGVNPELHDSDVQQFVNSKTNRPINFAIEHLTYEGTQLTVIKVAQKQQRPLFLTKAYGRLKKNVVYIRHGSCTEEASPDEIAEMAKQEVAIGAPDVAIRFQIAVNAYSIQSDFPLGFKKEEPRYFDGLKIVARNNGNALARHIQGTIELPRGVLMDYLDKDELKKMGSIAQTKLIKLEFSNYLRAPSHHYLAKPNPLEWKPLLPGREMTLYSGRTLPLRECFNKLNSSIKWELAVDNCSLQQGETSFADIPIVEKIKLTKAVQLIGRP